MRAGSTSTFTSGTPSTSSSAHSATTASLKGSRAPTAGPARRMHGACVLRPACDACSSRSGRVGRRAFGACAGCAPLACLHCQPALACTVSSAVALLTDARGCMHAWRRYVESTGHFYAVEEVSSHVQALAATTLLARQPRDTCQFPTPMPLPTSIGLAAPPKHACASELPPLPLLPGG